MSQPSDRFSLRRIVLPAVLPTLLFSIGEGAILPLIPIVADGLGATLAVAGFIAALIMIGELVGDIPSGWVVARIGERTAMVYAALVSILGLVIALLAQDPWVLAVGILLIGLSTAVFALARHAFMTTFVPRSHRARALSMLGGTSRLGFFVGPLISSLVILVTGSSQSVFWIHIAGCVGAAVLLLVMRDPAATTAGPTEGEALVAGESTGLFSTIWAARAVLSRVGLGAALVGAVRASRQVILPLWAVSIGLADANAALIIGLAGAVDFALFYTSGQIMDRFGRLWSGVPSMLGLAAGHLVLAFSHDSPLAVGWFIAAAILMSVANGIGSGLLMTLGSDLADQRNPAPFLGAWRFIRDAGGAAAPLLIAGTTAVATIAVASGAVAGLAVVGAVLLVRYVPRYAPRHAD